MLLFRRGTRTHGTRHRDMRSGNGGQTTLHDRKRTHHRQAQPQRRKHRRNGKTQKLKRKAQPTRKGHTKAAARKHAPP
eukprot:4576612-Prymnesium_polylepis.1